MDSERTFFWGTAYYS